MRHGFKLGLERAFPDMAYFNVTALTILTGLAVVAAEAWVRNRRGIVWRQLGRGADRSVVRAGWALGLSLVVLQILFH